MNRLGLLPDLKTVPMQNTRSISLAPRRETLEIGASPHASSPLDVLHEDVIFGRSEPMKEVRESLARLASTSVPVLVTGESGSGKDVMARLIHDQSSRREGPFIKINCPAIPSELIESELFGYEQGAFTGAYRTKPGLTDRAQGGTLFLDEIADGDISFQAKVLHLLQDGTFTRVGGDEEKRADCRIICATSRHLEHEVEAGTFRQDLFYRINVISIEMPALRHRLVDVPELAAHFLQLYQKEYASEVPQISTRVMQLMMRHNWPGNIRELENLIRRYVVLGAEEAIVNEILHLDKKPLTLGLHGDGSISLKSLTRQAVRELERQIILDVLHANNWNRREAARVLKISYRGLFYKLKDAGVSKTTERSEGRKAAPSSQSPEKRIEL